MILQQFLNQFFVSITRFKSFFLKKKFINIFLCVVISLWIITSFSFVGFDLSFLQKSILLDCETQIESLLANVFENYKSLDEGSTTGFAVLFGPTPESAAPALAPAVQVYILLHDILTLDAQTMLRNYLQVHEKCQFITWRQASSLVCFSLCFDRVFIQMRFLTDSGKKEVPETHAGD